MLNKKVAEKCGLTEVNGEFLGTAEQFREAEELQHKVDNLVENEVEELIMNK